MTIQEAIERAVYLVSGEQVVVHGAGRTDAGVHAIEQSAHLRIDRGPPTDAIHKALNSVLPPEIRILSATEMPSGFHARMSARSKHYLYRFTTSPVRPAIARRYSYWYHASLDVAAMRAAAARLRGRHDFAALASNPKEPRPGSTVRTIQAIHVFGGPKRIAVHVKGDGFLYNMVRNIAGSLFEVGRGKHGPEWIDEILASRDRRIAGPTLPPHGLFLVRVHYPKLSEPGSGQ